MRLSLLREFLRLQTAGGFLLLGAAALALILANTPLAGFYQSFLDTAVAVQFGALKIAKPLLLWINDGLMAVFFLLVGLEIKREVAEGELSSWRRAALPAVAAISGIAVPAALYLVINLGSPATQRGWAIPTATDIAFALGVLALLGGRAPAALKIFLLATAIIDDLGAIIIIALFYTEDLSLLSLLLGGAGVLLLAILNLLGVRRLAPYLLVGAAIWVCVLKSGIHATLAGVAVALLVPRGNATASPLHDLEHMLHPWVTFAIMPIFAFANAGVSFAHVSMTDLLAPLPIGIAAGLFVGKQVGVFAACWTAVRLGLCRLPQGISWAAFYGVCLLTGIGFTMSLFIGSLAFDDAAHAAGIRLGVLTGSIFSAVCGYLLLRTIGARGRAGAAREPAIAVGSASRSALTE
jgi:Na+:H+ antiporter, NhaA family